MVYIIVFAFIVVDYISGLVKGIKTNSFKSAVLRSGLYGKLGSVLAVVLGYLIDYAQGYLDLGFNIPVTQSVCVYIVIMEITSIIENIGEINPEIVPEKLRKVLGVLDND